MHYPSLPPTEAFWFRPVNVTATAASMRPKSGRIVYAGFDFPHPIRFRSVLFVSVRFPSSKEGPDHVVQKQARIQSGWPAQILANRICFRRKPVCKNHRARFCPLSYSFAFFHRRAGSYLLCSLDHIYCAVWIIFIVQPGSYLLCSLDHIYCAAWIRTGSGWMSDFGQTDPVLRTSQLQRVCPHKHCMQVNRNKIGHPALHASHLQQLL